MWASIIAVVGTLAGGLLTGGLQARIGRAARRDDRAEARRTAQVDAVAALMAALEDHRRAMWVREDLRLRDGDRTDAYTEARAASHATRAAVSAPMTRLSILAPELHDSAREAAAAAYALRGAPDRATLDALRESALRASERLVAAAGTYLTV